MLGGGGRRPGRIRRRAARNRLLGDSISRAAVPGPPPPLLPLPLGARILGTQTFRVAGICILPTQTFRVAGVCILPTQTFRVAGVLARAKRERVVQDEVEKANRRPTDRPDRHDTPHSFCEH